jgi:hypothetical protein
MISWWYWWGVQEVPNEYYNNSCHLMCEYLSWLHVWDLLSQSSLWIDINSIHIHTNAVYLVVSDRKGVYPCNWISAS